MGKTNLALPDNFSLAYPSLCYIANFVSNHGILLFLKVNYKSQVSPDPTPNPIKRSHSITFGYSDTEDRIWVRMLLEGDAEVYFWINRRLCKAIYNAMADLLIKNKVIDGQELASKALEQHLKAEFYELSRSTFDPAPPPPKSDTSKTEQTAQKWVGLCHSVSITSGARWLMSFSTKGTDYQLGVDRRSMIKVFVGLLKTCAKAAWDIPKTHKWIYY